MGSEEVGGGGESKPKGADEDFAGSQGRGFGSGLGGEAGEKRSQIYTQTAM